MMTIPDLERCRGVVLATALTLAACSGGEETSPPGAPGGSSDRGTAGLVDACDPDDGGISLPPGFCAIVVAEVGPARHLDVAENGDVFVALSARDEGGPGVVALRDTTGDGRADVEERWGVVGGTGIRLHDGHLYFGADDAVLRYPLPAGSLTPSGPPDTVVRGLPDERSHRAKSLAIDDRGNLFVNVGSPSNSCQEEDRAVGSPGVDPCPELETRAGIWRFHADSLGQTQSDGVRHATGMRNTVALTLHPGSGELYGAIHGRDQLHQNWGELFDTAYSARNPAEELVRIREGDDYGWPYCYHENDSDTKILAPEYGGDGEAVGRCAEKDDPLVAFPGHWAPNALTFYTASHFPPSYRGGAFIAFHGSWNRAPMPQGGYNVVHVPFEGGAPSGEWSVFAEGFPRGDPSPRGAAYRPTGLSVGPDGSLFISDSEEGRIWRVLHDAGD